MYSLFPLRSLSDMKASRLAQKRISEQTDVMATKVISAERMEDGFRGLWYTSTDV